MRRAMVGPPSALSDSHNNPPEKAENQTHVEIATHFISRPDGQYADHQPRRRLSMVARTDPMLRSVHDNVCAPRGLSLPTYLLL